jgi:hypothetical protein
MQSVQPHWKTVLQFLTKLNTHLLHNTANLPLALCKGNIKYAQKYKIWECSPTLSSNNPKTETPSVSQLVNGYTNWSVFVQSNNISAIKGNKPLTLQHG